MYFRSYLISKDSLDSSQLDQEPVPMDPPS